jgi:hypothetical protein
MSAINFDMMLRDGRLSVPPLEIRVLGGRRGGGQGTPIDVAWRGRWWRFVAEVRRDAKPLTLKVAMEQVRGRASASGQRRPMIIAPYLSGEKLEQLLGAGVSALDFSGNAAIEVPGEFLFFKTGSPNLYPDSTPIRSAYRGDGSLVARVLLLERQFDAIGAILASIRSRGGALTLGTVSKVLQRLEADLAIERPSRNTVRVIQAERLLDGLLDAYQAPKAQEMWTGKVGLPASKLLNRLEGQGGDGGLVRTGEASAPEYAAWAGEPVVACYCQARPATVLARLGTEAKETRAFANLRLIQTGDQLVYFDRRANLTASPIQAWLEMASGDKRQKEAAEQIRRRILSTTEAAIR